MSESMGRRQFIERAATYGAVAGLTLAHPSSAVAEPASDTVVVGVMGLSRGRALANGFSRQPGVTVKYVCDVDSHRAASCAQEVSAATDTPPEAVRDFRRILDDKSVDALVCAAPNHWHAPATILACAAGKHVYVEKPCSHNPREGELMVDAARKHNRVVQLGTQRRSSVGTMEAMRLLREGAIGRVYLARSWYNDTRGPIGRGKPAAVPGHLDYDLWQGPAPRKPYVDNLVHYNWHWRWHWGNGELGNNGVHSIDLCRWGLQVDFPIHVTSSGGRYHYDDDQETPDTHTVCFDFEGNKSITWQGLSCNRQHDGFVMFYGDNGALKLDANGSYAITDPHGRPIKKADGEDNAESNHLANFLTAVRQNDPQRLNAEIAEGHKSTLLCHLGNIAQRTGRSLRCDSRNGHVIDDADAMKLWSRQYESGWEPAV